MFGTNHRRCSLHHIGAWVRPVRSLSNKYSPFADMKLTLGIDSFNTIQTNLTTYHTACCSNQDCLNRCGRELQRLIQCVITTWSHYIPIWLTILPNGKGLGPQSTLLMKMFIDITTRDQYLTPITSSYFSAFPIIKLHSSRTECIPSNKNNGYLRLLLVNSIFTYLA